MYDRSYLAQLLGGQVIRLLVVALFLNVLAITMKRVDSKNRTMSPGLVWLNLIPLFDYIWIPITLSRVRQSLRNEYAARGFTSTAPESSFKIGMTSWIFYLANLAVQFLAAFTYDSAFVFMIVTALVYLGFWIAYWATVSSIRRELERPLPVQASSAGQEGSLTGQTSQAASAEALRPAVAPVTASGAPVSAEDVEQVVGEVLCPHCGTDVREDALFCSSCGRTVS